MWTRHNKVYYYYYYYYYYWSIQDSPTTLGPPITKNLLNFRFEVRILWNIRNLIQKFNQSSYPPNLKRYKNNMNMGLIFIYLFINQHWFPECVSYSPALFLNFNVCGPSVDDIFFLRIMSTARQMLGYY